MPAAPFLSTTELRALARRRSIRIVDARSERAYAAGHLPGAVNLPARDLNDATDGVRCLVDPDALAARARDRGIGAGPVVLYGAHGGSDAAHAWWTLHVYGHPRAYLLDGGIEIWRAEGGGLERTPVEPAPPEMPFVPRLEPGRTIDLAELQARLDDASLALVDTRSREEYRGELSAAARGGHIPGARLFDWEGALTAAGALRPDAELRAALTAELAADEVAVYCQSGVRAAHTYAVLTALGHPDVRLYLASWGEWGNRNDTPVASGTDPSATRSENPPLEV